MSTKYNFLEGPHTGAEPIGERRRRLGISQQEVARLADCSVARVGQLERGMAAERSAVLDRISAVLERAEAEAVAS